MSKKENRMLIRIIVTAVLFSGLFAIDKLGLFECVKYESLKIAIFAVPYLIIGYDVILKSIKNIRKGHVFDENFLMTIATVAAFVVSEYLEAVAVMLFYQVGELFQSYAVGKSRKSIADMMDICPEYANMEKDGELVTVDPDDVETGAIIVVKPGERIPLDGIVIEGESMIDTAALTGESVPRRACEGSEVISGCINGNGTLKVQVTKAFEDSTVARILELVENASSKKAKVENFITRFAALYTPIVTGLALLVAVVPSIVTGDWMQWLHRACIFLVISCPCALVISVPLSFFGGIGAASKIGILVKGGNFLEAVKDVTTIVFDKTGTLTKGEFKVAKIYAANCTESELIEIAAHAEGYSTHPIAESIRDEYGKAPDMDRVKDVEEIPGFGVKAVVDGHEVLAGKAGLLTERNIEPILCNDIGTIIYVAVDGVYAGTIVIADSIKPNVKEAIMKIRAAGVGKTVMLTGDNRDVAAMVAKEIGIDEVRAELLPGDKVVQVEKLLNEGGKVAYVGDGINDAPVLSRADVGIAMGSMGSDAAIEAADIVIMDDDIGKIASIVKISGKTIRIVKQNIWFALIVKVAVMVLGTIGIANMWEAVFADVGVAVIAILNAMRCLKTSIDKTK